MTHHIKHPHNWPLDDLHNHLWKTFPMDRFEFIPSSGESTAQYAGTTIGDNPIFTVMRGEAPRHAFFDDVSEAIQTFLKRSPRERSGECSTEVAAEESSARHVA